MIGERAAGIGRRRLLQAGASGIAVLVMPAAAVARPTLDEAIRNFTDGAPVQEGRVRLDIPPLVENGNAVGVTLEADSPMTPEDHVRRMALFNERNPQADIAVFHLTPRSGRAKVATRIRLATSQTVMAIAEMSDGSFWSSKASVIVTLAACIEDSVMTRAMLNVPKTARAGEIIEIKAMIAHPMETGYQIGPNGRPIPRQIINRLVCTYDGEAVFEAELFPAVSANPFVAFSTVATRSGTIQLAWTDDDGSTQVASAEITVG